MRAYWPAKKDTRHNHRAVIQGEPKMKSLETQLAEALEKLQETKPSKYREIVAMTEKSMETRLVLADKALRGPVKKNNGAADNERRGPVTASESKQRLF